MTAHVRHRAVSLRRALTDPGLLGSVLSGDTWRAWRTLLIAAMGEPLRDDERALSSSSQVVSASHVSASKNLLVLSADVAAEFGPLRRLLRTSAACAITAPSWPPASAAWCCASLPISDKPASPSITRLRHSRRRRSCGN